MNRTLQRWDRFWKRTALKLKDAYYKKLFAGVGPGTSFLGKIRYYNPEFITIGGNCSVNDGVFFNASRPILIGDNVTLSANVFVTTVTLDKDAFPRKEHKHAPVTIEANAWIGAGAVILPGIVVGNGAVIGAGAVVTRSVPAGETWGGVPAKPLERGHA